MDSTPSGNKPRPNNAHIHLPPNFSAFDTVAQAVALAADQGVAVLGASNYYDYRVYRDFTQEAARRGVFPLFGLEIITLDDDLRREGIKVNDPGNPGKFYVCGKGITRFDPMAPEAAGLLEVIRRNDSDRMATMTARMADVFTAQGLETGLTAAIIQEQIARRHDAPVDTVYLQERHVAQAFQEILFDRIASAERPAFLERLFGTAAKKPDDAVAVQGDIRSFLMKAGKPAFVEETFVDFDHAYRLILALGGIPCYPTLADGASPVCGFEDPIEHLIDGIKARRMPLAEFIPIRNQPDVLARYVRAMRAAGLAVTAGTEHNTLDLLPIAPACVGGQPIPADVQAIFWEGACVVAAHQYRTQRGEPGFVGPDGAPNPDYPTDDARIKAFARLGAEIIGRSTPAA